MAVVNSTEIWSAIRKGVTKDGKTGIRVFSVLLDGTDAITDALDVARAASGIPTIGQSWPNDIWLVCWKVDPLPQSKNANLVHVRCEYQRASWTSGPQPENPLDMPPKISWDTIVCVEPIDQDIDGNPIINSAGEPFDPPITDEIHDRVVRIERNEASWSSTKQEEYQNTVNEHTFMSAQPHEAWMMTLRADKIYSGDYVYYTVYYEIVFRTKTTENAFPWRRRVLDQGFRVRTGVDDQGKPKYENILDDNGDKITEPISLDGAGAKLADGVDPYWHNFQTKRIVSWSPLNLPEH